MAYDELVQKYPPFNSAENGRRQMIALSVLIIVGLLIYVSLIRVYRELRRPVFLEGVFGLTHSVLL